MQYYSTWELAGSCQQFAGMENTGLEGTWWVHTEKYFSLYQGSYGLGIIIDFLKALHTYVCKT